MIATGIPRPAEAYVSVQWNVILLLAGVLPLGLALQQTGGDVYLAGLLVTLAAAMPAILVLALSYLSPGSSRT